VGAESKIGKFQNQGRGGMPKLSDGSVGAEINLRPLFEQFAAETGTGETE
jgi:hypothetical protein